MDSEGSESGAVPSGFDLQSQINSVQEQLAQFQISSATRSVSQLLYVPRERKIRSFSGQEGDLGVQQFVAIYVACGTVRPHHFASRRFRSS